MNEHASLSNAGVRLPRGGVDSPVFARHETFAPRFGWLRKGFVIAAHDPTVFLMADAHLRLGVGKNMARAIRYWCHAFKLLEEGPRRAQRSTLSAPTAFGRRLLDVRGWDPYLEDPISLWLLHWRLFDRPCVATAWYFAFMIFSRLEFTIGALADELKDYVEREYPNARIAPSSIEKDAGCITRMYEHRLDHAMPTEETIQSPFGELGLLSQVGNRQRYRFEVGAKPGLESGLIVASSLEFAANTRAGVSTIPLSRLLHDPGSPGMAFKLSETMLADAIEDVARLTPNIRLADSAGLIQLSFKGSPRELSTRVLDGLYRGRARAFAA